MKTAYLTGYTGKPTRNPEQLRRLAISLDAVVVDARCSPRSRVHHWNMGPLETALGGHVDNGGRYLYVHQFGNELYWKGEIKLHDPETGLKILEDYGIDCAIILCACADGESCHRKQVGEYLAAHGWTVREVTQAEWEAAR